MNTLGLLQISEARVKPKKALQENRSIHDSMNLPKSNSFLKQIGQIMLSHMSVCSTGKMFNFQRTIKIVAG